MKKSILLSIALIFALMISRAQTPFQFNGLDCNGDPVDLFADLDAGKAAILHFYMPSCGSCPPPAQKIQAMANNINAVYPGMVKGFAFPYQNSTTCTYSSNWVASNGLGMLYQPMDSGATQVAYYGGFGMPTVVLLGGAAPNRRVMFFTMSFSTNDTTIMRDSILALLNGPTGTLDLPNEVSSFNVYPNPANNKATVTIYIKENVNLLVDITDISGKQLSIIMEEKLNGTVEREFSTETLPNGNYFVRINLDGKIATQKLSIMH